MTDLIIPPQLVPAASMSWGFDDFTAVDQSATSGAVQTSAMSGAQRWHIRLDYPVLRESDGTLAIFEAFLAQLRRGNRVWVPHLTHVFRGAMPCQEVLPNGTFANGAAGWSNDSNIALSVDDRVMRSEKTATTNGSAWLGTENSLTVTQYGAYAFRILIQPGKNLAATDKTLRVGSTFMAADYLSDSGGISFGMACVSVVPLGAGAYFSLTCFDTSAVVGDFLQIPYASVSRCGLVDNGDNLFLESVLMSNAAWTKNNVTVGSATTDINGASTAWPVSETTANASHYIFQAVTIPASECDVSFTALIKSGLRNYVALDIYDGTHESFQVFNLSTGAVGATHSTGGGVFQNVRCNIVPAGSGFYKCTLTVRKTGSSTSINGYLIAYSADSSGADTYMGNASSAAFTAARPTIALSSAEGSISGTGSAALATGAPQSGAGLLVKGLPANTSGLAKAGDFAEIGTPENSQLVRLTAPLNSDASGIGYMRFEPPLERSPASNAPVIFNAPMGRFLLASSNAGVELTPGVFGQASIELIEA